MKRRNLTAWLSRKFDRSVLKSWLQPRLNAALRLSLGICFGVFLGAFLGACQGERHLKDSTSTGSNGSNNSVINASSDSTNGIAKIIFHQEHFYSLNQPEVVASCAGDIKNYFDPKVIDPITLEPTPLATDPNEPTRTKHPDFIKNVSVDITDANIHIPLNESYTCSFGDLSSSLPPNSCARFDYGLIGGIPSSLGGSLLLLGGTSPSISSHLTSLACSIHDNCLRSVYALGIDLLPSTAAGGSLAPGAPPSLTVPPEKISTWGSIIPDPSGTLPPSTAGATAAYSDTRHEVVYFGGVAQSSETDSTRVGHDTFQTWIFNTLKQSWTKVSQSPQAGANIHQICYHSSSISAPCETIEQNPGPLAQFGMIEFPWSVIKDLVPGSLNLTLKIDEPTSIDPTIIPQGVSRLNEVDQILMVGGLNGNTILGQPEISRGTYIFNPTFGPHIMNSSQSVIPAYSPQFWANSYHTQVISNPYEKSPTPSENRSSEFDIPYFYGTPYGALVTTDHPTECNVFNERRPINFGLVPALINGASLPSTSPASTLLNKIGSAIALGGFDAKQNSTLSYNDATFTSYSTSLPSPNCSAYYNQRTREGGAVALSFKDNPKNSPDYFTRFIGQSVDMPSTTTGGHSQRWIAFDENSGAKVTALGGTSTHRGYSVAENEILVFGGSTCRDYINTSSLAACSSATKFSNLITQYKVSAPNNELEYNKDPNPAPGSTPQKLLKSSYSPSVSIAKAGMASARGLIANGSLYKSAIVLYGGTNGSFISPVDTNHVLLFIINPTPSGSDLYSIPLSGSSVTPLPLVNSQMVFSHITKKFYLFGGASLGSPTQVSTSITYELTLDSSCGSTPAASSCQATFRELNTNAGLTCYPSTCPTSRRSHRMVEVNYNNLDPLKEPIKDMSCSSSTPCSFGIFMYGGTSDGMTALADRWMFDPTANNGNGHWQQVDGFPPRHHAASIEINYTPTSATTPISKTLLFGGETALETDLNGSYLAPTLQDTYLYAHDTQVWNRTRLLGAIDHNFSLLPAAEFRKKSAFTPPPLSGAVLVKRTKDLTLPPEQQVLNPPQVYLLGGRTNRGDLNPLTKIYQFCIGGECGSSTLNANEEGQWILNATSTSSPSSFYLGAAVYDSQRDRILFYGGKTVPDGQPITQSPTLHFADTIYELDPSTMSWSAQGACGTSTATPSSGRYGHSMGYNPLTGDVIITGGYNSANIPLTQANTDSNGAVYFSPDVRIAHYDSTNHCYEFTTKTRFGNTTTSTTQAPPNLGIAHAASVFIPPTTASTGYYSMNDSSCVGNGPIGSADPNLSKRYAGGVYIDIDREKLGARENLLLHLTYLSLGSLQNAQEGSIKIHLVRSGQSADDHRRVPQPRYLTFFDKNTYPEIVDTLSSRGSIDGEVTQEQFLLPIGTDPSIDRIRIERQSGDIILLEADVIRLGPHS